MLIGMSFFKLLFVMVIGAIRAVTPRIMRVLNIFEPTMLPIAMSAFPCNDERKLTTISGVDVPMPTIVNPMTNSLIPNLFATLDEPSTSQLAPKSIRSRPDINIKICRIILS